MPEPTRRTPTIAGDAVFLIVVVAAGVALRLAWLSRTEGGIIGFAGGGEAARIALTLAREGRFADAFWPGSGPSAHVMPVSPAIAALVFRLFPPASPAAAMTLLAWALVQMLAAIGMTRLLFARLGADPRALRWATAMLLLVPVYAPDEVISFRYWEGALTVCLSAAALLTALDVERRGALSARAALGAAALWAAVMFGNPIAGAALALVWAWVALRRLPMRESMRFALLSAAAGAMLLVPWTIRNAHELDAPIVLRSNFGLEFAIGNHAAALSPAASEQTYAARLRQVHPLHGAAGREAFTRAGGEVAYARRLGAETRRWIAADPFGFARLALRHLSEFLFPCAWQMLFSGWEEWTGPRAALVALVDLTGLLTIAAGVIRRRAGYALLAIFVAAVALPYALVQPIPRYTYLVWALLAFAAWDGIVRLGGAAKPR